MPINKQGALNHYEGLCLEPSKSEEDCIDTWLNEEKNPPARRLACNS